MGTTLTGTTPQDTYDSLIKVTDNGPLSGTAKYLSDGLGNDSALALSTAAVGIGLNTPSIKLEVQSTDVTVSRFVSTNAANTGEIAITSAGGVGNNTRGRIVGGFDAGGSAFGGFLAFNTTTTQNVNNERMRITEAGNVGIGTSAPASILAVSAASPTITLTATTTTATTIGNKNNRLLLLSDSTTAGNGGEVVFGTGDTNIGRWGAISGNITANNGTGSAGSIIFATKAAAVDTSLTERMRVLADGGLTFNGDTAQANALDDYEEGTWTMGVSFGGASVGVTTLVNTGTYTKIGRQVTVNGYLVLTSKGSSTGTAKITGLPFTIAFSDSNYSSATLRLDSVTFANQFQGYGVINTTTIDLEEITEAGTRTKLTDADFANNSSIMVSLTYFV
jgi:hypothetical protein